MSFEEIDLQWFAAEDEGRTEDASEFKIEKARKEGRVAKSPEISAALVLLFGVVTLMIMSETIWMWCKQILVYYFGRINEPLNQGAFFMPFLFNILKIVIPLCVVGIIAGVAANIIQNKGFLFTTKPIEPDFTRIIPKFGEYLKKTLFSAQGAFNVVKSLVKVICVCFTAYIFIKGNLQKILYQLNVGNIATGVSSIAGVAWKILITSAIIFLVISIPDYLVQRKQFLDSLKMTKQEQKEEYKEMEGDPEVKSKLNQAQRSFLSGNVVQAVKESDVVITNPTHFAVALKYDISSQVPPMINAKGQDEMAQRIKAIAKENDIPLVENRPLARGLFQNTQVGDILPEAYFRIVGAIYAKIGAGKFFKK